METIRISEIHPAGYNPRKISKESFSELRGSISTLGFILPIIVNKDNMTIVAGHQRTKAAVSLGIESVPAVFVSGVTLSDEVRFNQLHNSAEGEPEKKGRYNGGISSSGIHEDVPCDDFEIPEHYATVTKDIAILISSFGDAMCCVVCGGVVVLGNNYVKAAKLLNKGVRMAVVARNKMELLDYYFSKDYGTYSYDLIERKDFVQGLAQMSGKKFKNSRLYATMMPFLKGEDKDVTILDFGCGKGYGVEHLRKSEGFLNAIGLEFFNNNRFGVSASQGQMMIDSLIRHVRKHGKFDYVICDSVLNSVNTQEAEDCVIATLLLFCKTGGRIFFCGRTMENVESVRKQKRNTSKQHSFDFCDENGLTGMLREGQWYFQKFQTKEQVTKIIDRIGLEVLTRREDSGMWRVGGVKTRDLTDDEYMKAIDFEFNMVLPGGIRYGRHNDIRKLFGYPEKEK